MKTQIKTITISLNQKTGVFSSFFNKFKSKKPTEIECIRQFLSNERAKMLHVIKTKNPESLYDLAKRLKRDFKAVRQDIKLLEHFGIVELEVSYKNGRERLKPVINANQILITVNL